MWFLSRSLFLGSRQTSVFERSLQANYVQFLFIKRKRKQFSFVYLLVIFSHKSTFSSAWSENLDDFSPSWVLEWPPSWVGSIFFQATHENLIAWKDFVVEISQWVSLNIFTLNISRLLLAYMLISEKTWNTQYTLCPLVYDNSMKNVKWFIYRNNSCPRAQKIYHVPGDLNYFTFFHENILCMGTWIISGFLRNILYVFLRLFKTFSEIFLYRYVELYSYKMDPHSRVGGVRIPYIGKLNFSHTKCFLKKSKNLRGEYKHLVKFFYERYEQTVWGTVQRAKTPLSKNFSWRAHQCDFLGSAPQNVSENVKIFYGNFNVFTKYAPKIPVLVRWPW